MHPSKRIVSIQPAIMQELQQYFTPRTISFAQGVPFFPPPGEALSSMKGRIGEHGSHNYSPDAGLPELREALSEKLKKENGICATSNQIMVTAGANQGFVNAVLSIADIGDEIILLRPYYFNHEMALRMFGITPVLVDVDEEYQPVPDAIREAITERTRAVITVSPNNPTGAVYEPDTLKHINTICHDHGIYHISDEPYEYFTFGDTNHYSPGAGGEEHTITLHSFSKTFGMPGWRIGYMSYPEHLHDPLLKVQDTVVICPSVMGQFLARECLRIGRKYVDTFLCVMDESRRVMLSHLRELEGLDQIISVPETTGGFYFYPRVKGISTLSGRELAVRLVKEYDVAVVPGEPFGSTDGCYLRLSFGNVLPDATEEGMDRLSRGIREILFNNN